MELVADTHAHLYPAHDAGAALRSAARNLAGLASSPRAGLALVLLESATAASFRHLRDGGLQPGDARVEVCDDPRVVALSWPGDPVPLLVVAGRQLVTRDRLEVLAVACDADVPDGLEASEALARVREAGGLPVLAWSPGKWSGARGARIAALIDAARDDPGNDAVALGDTPLRPRGFPEPRLMRWGRRHGLPVLAGTDPLPAPDEADLLGTYATRWDDGFDPDRPAASLYALLTAHAASGRRVGRRCGPLSAARRWLRHALRGER